MKIREYKLISQKGDEGDKEFEIIFEYESNGGKNKNIQLIKLHQFENDMFTWLLQTKNMKAINYLILSFKRCFKDRYKIITIKEKKVIKNTQKKQKK